MPGDCSTDRRAATTDAAGRHDSIASSIRRTSPRMKSCRCGAGADDKGRGLRPSLRAHVLSRCVASLQPASLAARTGTDDFGISQREIRSKPRDTTRQCVKASGCFLNGRTGRRTRRSSRQCPGFRPDRSTRRPPVLSAVGTLAPRLRDPSGMALKDLLRDDALRRVRQLARSGWYADHQAVSAQSLPVPSFSSSAHLREPGSLAIHMHLTQRQRLIYSRRKKSASLRPNASIRRGRPRSVT